MRILFALAAALLLPVALSSAALADRTPAPDGAEVYFITPEEGATVSSPVTVKFGLKGMGIAPAGVAHDKTGHHHLLIDTGLPEGEDLDYAIPADDTHVHFGGGQTETTVELEPGTHTLQLLLGDANHIPHDPPVASEQITITVE
ncbi:DUF4399 domain-containing protein [Tepidicaulis sp. LMO-SS28]|uniref:DUF4399 domain-containing protein n=1 Tax=Tepidicaulis sp. LMO-SS28 TaxID=3447455 RepID=UPI003EE24299